MIACVNGEVTSVGMASAVVECAGLGYEIFAAPSTLAGLRVGEQARLSTCLVVREDSLTLYGFSEPDERDLFTRLQSVSGVGPRIALAILSQFTPDLLRAAIASSDVAAMKRVPGIGAKGAQRLILELRGKIGEPGAASLSVLGGAAPSAFGEVVSALVGLGWPESVASDAVAAVTQGENAPHEVADVLKQALRTLGGSRV